MENQTDWEEEISLFDLINVLVRRKWLIIGITLLVMIVAFLAWKFVPQTYKAEFTVSFAESSFPEEFKGQVSVTYYGDEEPTLIPYSLALPQEKKISPERALLSFTERQKLAELAEKGGFGDLFRQAGGTVSASIDSLEKPETETEDNIKEFSVLISTRNEELCEKLAQNLQSEIKEELLLALNTQHNIRLEFYQNLLATLEEKQKTARDELLTFLEYNDPLKPEREIEKVEEALEALLETRKTLLSQQYTPLVSSPLSVESLEGLLFMPQDKINILETEIKKSYREKLADLEKAITALHKEKAKLELEKLKQDDLIDTYNQLLRDYTFWKEVKSSLLLSLSPLARDGAYPFDGKMEVGEIKYSGSGRDLKLNLAVGLVAGLFLGVFVAFFVEFWEKAKAQRS
ncbi:MAG: hypothetical protein PWP60_1092 [Candidatus Atribacteria bacterium]|uniref:Wzz/FepE/Etk N-terminal domain-containing protein n=1 Tax=Atrimonas thermophila TaxID=3064161 RepID=UPI0024ABAD15|nr:hypothetical protein [Candidatus Atribacteria bacterium]